MTSRNPFWRVALALVAALLLPLAGFAQSQAQGQSQQARTLRAGVDYSVIANPAPQDPRYIDVVYFFWYGSPWSARFDPMVRKWVDERAPTIVRFKPSPVVMQDDWAFGARIFHALDEMGLESRISPLLTRAISEGAVDYNNPSSVRDFLVRQGVDKDAFQRKINSPMVIAKATAAPRHVRLYGLHAVPTVVVDGRFVFHPQAQGNPAELLDRVSYAVEAIAMRRAAAANASTTPPAR